MQRSPLRLRGGCLFFFWGQVQLFHTENEMLQGLTAFDSVVRKKFHGRASAKSECASAPHHGTGSYGSPQREEGVKTPPLPEVLELVRAERPWSNMAMLMGNRGLWGVGWGQDRRPSRQYANMFYVREILEFLQARAG